MARGSAWTSQSISLIVETVSEMPSAIELMISPEFIGVASFPGEKSADNTGMPIPDKNNGWPQAFRPSYG
jgi:hypothetical protein